MTPLPAIEHDRAGQCRHLQLDGHRAELTYQVHGGRMVIEHTRVPEAIGGRGLAGHLVQAAFDRAREEGWKVVPACSYAQVWVERHRAYADLLAD